MTPEPILASAKPAEPDVEVLIVPAQLADLDEATTSLVCAFAPDPLIDFFFLTIPERRNEALREFFWLLLCARVELNMPVLVAKDEGRGVGAVMGYSTHRPDWPAALNPP